MATISINNASVVLGDPPSPVLQEFSMTFDPGAIHLVLGANGSGKTILLRTLLGLQRLRSGTVTLDGEPLTRRSRRTLHSNSGVTFQNTDIQIFGDTVLEDLQIGRDATFQPDPRLLSDFGLAHLLQKPPSELSGGQRRRLAIAGALIGEPKFLFLDEPFLELDYPHILNLVARLQTLRSSGTTIIIASHETQDVWGIVDNVVLITEGRIVGSGPPKAVAVNIGPEIGLRPIKDR